MYARIENNIMANQGALSKQGLIPFWVKVLDTTNELNYMQIRKMKTEEEDNLPFHHSSSLDHLS